MTTESMDIVSQLISMQDWSSQEQSLRMARFAFLDFAYALFKGLDTKKSRALMDLYETTDTVDTAFSDPNQAIINALIMALRHMLKISTIRMPILEGILVQLFFQDC